MNPTRLSTAQRQLARQIRHGSHDGQDLLDVLGLVARGDPVPQPDGEALRPTPALQRKAARLLQVWDQRVLLDRLDLLDEARVRVLAEAVDPVVEGGDRRRD
jgi:hypothetical protein